MKALQFFTHSRFAWFLLFLSAFSLEGAALYFQYGLGYEPCVMCIYIRVAVLGIMLAGMIGMLMPKWWIFRFVGMSLWIVSAVWGTKLSFELNTMQVEPNPFATCSFFPDFPKSLPLDKWLPQVFEPTGMCGDATWQFMSVSMVQWMIIVFITYCFIWLAMLLPTLTPKRTN